jgi:hypothetical protein
MYFIHPEILWGLLAVLIPLVIHLFNFRRYRKMPFSNIEFLKNITRQTRKQNKIKHLVVLLLRMAAVVLIVIAFAGPRFDKNKRLSNSKVKSIYIDNSFSMMAEGENGMLFENARQIAAELIKSSGHDERYLLQTNDYNSGKLLLNRDEVLTEIDRLKVKPATRMLSSVENRQLKMLNKVNGYESFWFSDFQRNSTDINSFQADTLNSYYFFPLRQIQSKNIYIDSCYFTKPLTLPGKQAQLKVVLVNTSDAAYEKVPLTLFINGSKRAVAGIDLPATKRVEVTLSFTTNQSGWQSGKLTIEDYPITFDDELYFTFNVNQRIKVLDVYAGLPNHYFKIFYETDSSFVFDVESYLKLDLSTFQNYELIILDGLPEITSGLLTSVTGFLNKGGNVMLVPGKDADLTSINRFLNQLEVGRFAQSDTSLTRVKGIKRNDPLFKNTLSKIPENASLPNVSLHYPLKYSIASGTESLLTLLNGDNFLVRKRVGDGTLFVLASPVEKSSTDFAFNPLFVPVMYGAAFTSIRKENLFWFIGNSEKVAAPVPVYQSGDSPVILKQRGSKYSFIPGQQQIGNRLMLFPSDGINQAGIYDALLEDSVKFSLAFNFNRMESEMKFFSEQELDSLLKAGSLRNYAVLDGKINNVVEVINQQQKGAQIWKLFIIFALLLLLVEVAILRWWK